MEIVNRSTCLYPEFPEIVTRQGEIHLTAIVYQTNKKTGVTYAYESVSYWDKENTSFRQQSISPVLLHTFLQGT